MKILVTGAAGFIGHHLVLALLERGHQVVGLDSINDYYDQSLKFARLREAGISDLEISYGIYATSTRYSSYRFVMIDITDRESLTGVTREEAFDLVCHLAAQAGVRYSLENPQAYIDANITGFLNILEECCRGAKTEEMGGEARLSTRAASVRTDSAAGLLSARFPAAGEGLPPIPLVYASSSSVYGENQKVPFSEEDAVENPASLYAVSKRSNELMARTYSRLYGLPAVGLRFFTVYGPWGRPDMSPILFADAISAGCPLKVFNNGEMKRDFTYIDDIVEGVVRVAEGLKKGAAAAVFQTGEHVASRGGTTPGACSKAQLPGRTQQPTSSTQTPATVNEEHLVEARPPHRVYNIGHGSPVHLMDFISEMENALGRKAQKKFLPMQAGDVSVTWADTTALEKDFGYRPETNLRTGIARFVEWYRGYYRKG